MQHIPMEAGTNARNNEVFRGAAMDLGDACQMPDASDPGTQDAFNVLAHQGLSELRQLIACVKQMFSLLGYGGSGAAGWGGGDVVEHMAAAQQTYLGVSTALRQTLKACEQRSLPAAPGASGAEAGPLGQPLAGGARGSAAAAGVGSAGRRLHLQGLVASNNELVKQLVDQLRQMLECMSMWDAQKAQLERARQQAER